MLLYNLLTLTSVTAIVSAGLIQRQAESSSRPLPSGVSLQVITTSVFPGGVATRPQTFESTIPLPCVDGCYQFAPTYSYCFLYDTYLGGRPVPSNSCEPICVQSFYDGLSACLNCVVAHGGEKPFGYSTNTSITAQPTRTPQPGSIGAALTNPNGLVDAAQANAWLKNVTDLCNPKGVTLTGLPTVTAQATTTGPFAASWSSGETISRTAWTGLAQYSPPIATLTQTTFGRGPSSGASGAAASQSSQAAGISTIQPARWVLGGAMLAWAVL